MVCRVGLEVDRTTQFIIPYQVTGQNQILFLFLDAQAHSEEFEFVLADAQVCSWWLVTCWLFVSVLPAPLVAAHLNHLVLFA